MWKTLKIEKNQRLIIFKLANDLLLISTGAFFLFLLVGAVIPGMVLNRIDFTALSIFLLIVLAANYYLGKNLELDYQLSKNKKALLALALLMVALFLNSIRNLDIWLVIPITLATVSIGYLSYRGVVEGKE